MALVAGLAIGIWLILPSRRLDPAMGDAENGLLVASVLLGGLSIVGPPLLIWERRRRRRDFGAGRLLWFSHGMASWLLWPPIVYTRVRQGSLQGSSTAGCFAYGTPLMALYVGSALLFGGGFRKRRRRALARSWRERFGLGLALAWACLGLYVLSIFYREEFQK